MGKSGTAVVEWQPNEHCKRLEGADYYTLHQCLLPGYQEITNEMMAPVDWAKLNSGGCVHGQIVKKLSKLLPVPLSPDSSWELKVSRDVGLVLGWQTEEAYFLDFAERLSDYKRIYYRPCGPPSPLFREVVNLTGLPISILSGGKSETQEHDETENPQVCEPTPEVLPDVLQKKYIFFPHQSVFYGDLFVKDWPFKAVNPSEVAIIEWAAISEKAARYYRDCGIVWTSWSMLITKFGDKLARKAFAFARAMVENSFRISRSLYISRYLFGCRQAELILSNFKETRAAFIGYDMLFPPEISQGLKNSGIPSIAVQERPITSYITNQDVMIDHYIVPDHQCERAWKEKPFSRIGHMYVGGHWRLDIPFDNKKDTDEFILTLDYHADEISKWNSVTNWDNFNQFYQDLLALSEQCSDYQFVVRPKFFMIDRINPSLYRSLQARPNVRWDCSKLDNHSYQLLYACRLVFGRLTSLMDEARALGKPVVVHEHFCHSMPYLKNESSEYASFFDISNSVNEAEKLIRMRMSVRPKRSTNSKPKTKAILHEVIEQCPPRS